jgi:hypothetical protein
MRPELSRYIEQEYWVYGVSEADFEHTVALARRFVEAVYEPVRQKYGRLRESNPEQADDIMDDIVAHAVTEANYLWHSCLWRLQGLLETIVVCTFLGRPDSAGLLGLKAKLQAMCDAGFEVSEADWKELLAWGKVRNALSHAPPERERPGPLKESDVVEYQELATRLCQSWSAALGASPR